jgi:hypothetical protein
MYVCKKGRKYINSLRITQISPPSPQQLPPPLPPPPPSQSLQISEMIVTKWFAF